jgi:hypothetical protein
LENHHLNPTRMPDTVDEHGRKEPARVTPRPWRPLSTRSLLLFLLVPLLSLPYILGIRVDDAFITYRYAENLALHGQLAYNLQGDSAFATTAPGYALLLALLNRLGFPIPTTGNLLGALAIGLGALAMAELLRAIPRPGPFLGGLLLASSPLLWLVLGMEGVPALGLALLGFALASHRRDGWAAVALAAATLLRFDAIAAAAVWGLWTLARRRLGALRFGLLYAGIVIGGYALLMLLFGVPLPATLGSKQAQQTLGISGFFADTTWLSGALLLARAYLGHSLLHGLFGLIAFLGVVAAARQHLRGATGYLSPFLLLAWALAHAALYVALGVTPYVWYYLPLVVPLAAFAAIGLASVAARLIPWMGTRWRAVPVVALTLLILGGPAASHLAMLARLYAGADLGPPSLETKVLPEAKAQPYRQAGEWLAANAPMDSTVGVTEVGIMGFYSRQPMVDFLGLLDHDVAAALARGDLSWALYAQQPGYLVLSEVNPIYGFDVYKDRWFQGAYEPVHRIPGDGFWGGDLIIYRREVEPPHGAEAGELPPGVVPLAIRFGDELELAGVSMPLGPWQPGDPVGPTFFWRVLRDPPADYTMFLHLVDDTGRIVAGRDASPLLGSRPTSQWQAGELLTDFHPLGLPPLPQAPATLRYQLGFYDATGTRPPVFDVEGNEIPGGQARIEASDLLPAEEPVTMAAEHAGPEEAALVLTGYHLPAWELRPDEQVPVALEIAACDCPLVLALEMVDDSSGQRFWSHEVQVDSAGIVQVPVQVAVGAPQGWQPLRLRATAGGMPLFWLDEAGHKIQEHVPLTSLYLTP